MKIILDTKSLIMLLFLRFYLSEERQRQNKIKKFLEQQLCLDTRYWKRCFEFFAKELKNRHIFVTSYVLAEVTNILEKEYLKGRDYRELMEKSADFFKSLYEEHIEKDAIIDVMIEKKDEQINARSDKYFIEFGFADVSIYLALTKETNKNKNIDVFLLSEDKHLTNFCTYVEKFKNIMSFNEFVNQINEKYRLGYSLTK